jgi:hypothetical protein
MNTKHLLFVLFLMILLMSCRSQESNTKIQDGNLLISARQVVKSGDFDKAAELFAKICSTDDIIQAEKFTGEFLDEDFPSDPVSIFASETLDGKKLEPFHMIFDERKLFKKCMNALCGKHILRNHSESTDDIVLSKDFLASKSDTLRFIAKIKLMGSHDSKASYEELESVLDDPNPAITCFLLGMASYGLHDSEPFETGFKKTLHESLKNENQFVKLVAAKLLAERGDESSEKILIALLQSPYSKVRTIAQEGLGYNLQTEKAIEALEQVLQNETNPRSKDRIQRIIDTAKKGTKTGHSSIHYALMNSE